ncbi:MAG TPA: DUF4012 domain-containing protein, partial [Acidimicrobiales bacterium]|nr:DUF4012 domain-containing protein [Acidimicrobiales bacterium]
RPQPPSKGRRQASALVLSAVVAPLAGASPVGVGYLDVLWSVAIATVTAYVGSTAKRGPLLFGSLIAVVSSRSLFGVSVAIVSVVLGALSTRNLRRRAFFARAAAAGLMAASLLSSGRELPLWWTVGAVVAAGGPILVSGYRNAPTHLQRRMWWVGTAVAIFVVGATGLAALGAATSARHLDRGTVALQAGLSAARLGDATGAVGQLAVAEAELGRAASSMQRWGAPGRLVPITGQHVAALSDVLDGVAQVADQAAGAAAVVAANDLSVQTGRIDLRAVEALAGPLRRLALRLEEVLEDARRSANDPLVPPVKDRVRRFEEQAARAWRDAAIGAEAAATMPQLLGGDGPSRILVLFTSPAEARGRFGFPGSFAELVFTDGRVALREHGTTSAVFARLRPDQAAFDIRDPGLAPYVAYGPTQTLLSATIPPDFRTVARLSAELWRQSGREPVDGVVRMDPRSLAALLAFTGPLDLPDVAGQLDARNLEEYLVFDQYVEFDNRVAPRREVLDLAGEITMRRLQTADLPPPRQLVDVFQPLVEQGRFEVVAFDERAGAFLDAIGLSGAFDPPPGDGLAVTNVNVTGNKIDAFLTRSVRYEAQISDGRLEGTVSVELRNGAPADDLPLYVIGSATRPPLPLGTNRTTLVVYTSRPATRVLVDGVSTAFRSDLSDGRWVQQLVVELPPGATKQVDLTIEGDWSGPYELRIEPGGAVRADQYSVEVRPDGPRSEKTVTFSGRVNTPTVLR